MHLNIIVLSVVVGAVAGGSLQSPYVHDLPEDQLAVESGPQGNRAAAPRRVAPPRNFLDRTPSARVPIARPAEEEESDTIIIDAGHTRSGTADGEAAEENAEGDAEVLEEEAPGAFRPSALSGLGRLSLPLWLLSRGPVLILQPIVVPVAVRGAQTRGSPEYYGAAASPEAVGTLGVQALRRRVPFDVRQLNEALRGAYY